MKDSSVMPSIFDEAMKWLADNIKGTPWEASWNAFGSGRNGMKWWKCSGKCLIDRVSSEYLFAWLDACFMWWRTQVLCHPFSMRSWNGSLTISRGHPEKPVEMRLVLAEMAEICKNSEHAAENAWLTGSAVEEIICLLGLTHASCDEGLKCHAIHFRWGHEMARWQYQGDTLRSQLKCVWY